MKKIINATFSLALASALLVSMALGAACGTATITTTATQTATATATAVSIVTTTAAVPTTPANPELLLSSTTSTGDSGLMDVLIPIFEKQTGYKVKPVYIGSGAAMANGERGDADVLLVHAPSSEVTFMQNGHGTVRKLVMHNDFIIVGPASDPAGIKGMTSALEALKKIASAKAVFISRGDNSGTDQLEKSLWKKAAIEPKGQSWYQEAGQGMGATLSIASEKGAYTITDRGTYLARKSTLSLDILVQGDPVLLNIYHVIQVNPAKSTKINAEGAKAFADFMVNPATQEIIRTYGVEKYGAPLFFPDAGKTEAELGSV